MGPNSSDTPPAGSTPPDPAAAPQRDRKRLRRGRSGRAIMQLILRPLLGLVVLGVLAGFGLALRLAAGPLEVTWIAHALTPLPLGGRTGSQAGTVGRGSWGRLEIGRAWLLWDGFRLGVGAPVTLRLQDVSIRRADGAVADQIDALAVSLGAPGLLRGLFQVEEVAVTGARLFLRRDAQDGLGLGLAPVGQAPPRGSSGPPADWSRLRRVAISDTQLSVHDLVVGQDWRLRDIGIDLRPAGRGIVGRFGIAMLLDGRQSTLRGTGLAVPYGGDVTWHLTMDPVVPARLAGVLPVLAPLRAMDLAVSPVLDVHFANGPGQFMEPVQAVLAAGLGRGTLAAGGSTFRVEDGLVRLEASFPDGPQEMVTLQLLQADLALRALQDAPTAAATGPVLHAHGRIALDSLIDARRIRAALDVEIPRIGFDTLAQYWPGRAAAGARRWITANITAGEATGLHVETRLSGDQGWGSLAETARSGGFDADGLTLWWLRPIPPLVDMRAHMEFQGPDAVLITVPQAVLPVEKPGRPGRLAVSDSAMRITGLEARRQLATIQVRLSGDLGDLLAELAHPRLKLLSKHPVSFADPSGRTVDDVTVVLPLDNDVSIDQVRIEARSEMSGVHLGNVVAGRSLDRAQLSVSADTDGLTLDGDGLVGDVPARLHYAMDFRGGPPEQLTEQARVQAVITEDVLLREGLDPSDNISGSGRLSVEYAARRDGQASVSLGLDMTGLGISTEVWSKQAGAPAQASARIALLHGRLTAIDSLHATGAGLSLDAQAGIDNGRVRRVEVGHFVVGRSSGAGRVELPAAGQAGHAPLPIRVRAHGPVLDLSAAIGGRRKAPAPAAARPPAPSALVPWVADLAFGTVYVGPKASFGQVTAHVENDGRRVARAQVAAAAPTPVNVRLTAGTGGRRLIGSADDTGELLRTLGVTGVFAGGALRLDARFDDKAPGMKLAGTVTIGRFVVPDAPLAARIVRNLSIYGWLGALPTPQLAVDRLVAPFALRSSVLTLSDARAHSSSLGVTMRGQVDLARERLDLKGTVVPAWAVNQLPGRLPLVGRLLSPEKGGGVLAATVKIQGPFSGPDIRINALSALAPGVLRRLLFE